MKATLKTLKGKYYGTIIEIDFADGGDKETIKLWDSGDCTPSERELAMYGYTKYDWDNNILVDAYDGHKLPIWNIDLFPDSHFESELTYKRALEICKRINNN